jgi:acetyl esterase
MSTKVRAARAGVRLLAALPAPVQLLLAGGRPLRLDGQVLEPEVQLLLRAFALLGEHSLDKGTVEEARQTTRANAALVAPGTPLPMSAVEDLTAGGLPARLYVPPGVGEPSPLLVYFHGGGFVCGDLDTHDSACRFLAREAALRVLSVDYRMAPEHPFPVPVEDGLEAFRFAVREAEHLGADPARIAVGGDSAGGNLAASLALLAREERPAPAFQLLIYPVTDWSRKSRSYRLFHEGFFLTEADMDWYRERFLEADGDAHDPRASPLLADDLGGVAPACVAVAGFDPLRDEGIAYAERLEEAGVPVSLRVYWGLVHGFVNATAVGRSPVAAMREIAADLRRGLADA